jgi:creatine kinase
MNHAKNFIVWVNEEDHIRIISMQKGASLKQVWGRLCRVKNNFLNNYLSFSHKL